MSSSLDKLSALHANFDNFMLSHYEKADLDTLYRVNKLFRKLVIQECKLNCNKTNFIPESLPAGVNYKNFFIDCFPNRVDADFIRKNIGEVDIVPPVPIEFIERAQPDFNLAFIPEYITIETSTFELDGRNARLIENPNSELVGIVRKIKVPITLNNIIFLFQKLIPEFEGIKFAWQNILDQHGDVGVGPSHWSYQGQEVFGHGENYPRQVELATEVELEIVSLTERVFFDLITCMKTKKFPQSYVERTSTVTIDNDGDPWQSAIWWPAYRGSFRLSLNDHFHYVYFNSYLVCAVAGIPAGSSSGH